MKKFYGIGVGPGDPELITLKGVRRMKECDVILIPKSRGDSLAGNIASEYTEGKKVVELDFPMGEENGERYAGAAAMIDDMLQDGQSGVFLTIGDPMTYSTYIYLMFELRKRNIVVETVPGISSFHAVAACLNKPLVLKGESFYLCDGPVEDDILKNTDSICILKVSRNKEQILNQLEQHHFDYVYVRRCTQEQQKILLDKNEILEDNDYMALIFARRCKICNL